MSVSSRLATAHTELALAIDAHAAACRQHHHGRGSRLGGPNHPIVQAAAEALDAAVAEVEEAHAFYQLAQQWVLPENYRQRLPTFFN